MIRISPIGKMLETGDRRPETGYRRLKERRRVDNAPDRDIDDWDGHNCGWFTWLILWLLMKIP